MLRILFLSLVVCLCTLVAQADPIVITSGSGNDVANMPGVFNWVDLQNSDGSIQINLQSNANTVNPILPARFALPGQLLNLMFTGTGSDVRGTVVVNGVSFPGAYGSLFFTASVLTPLTAQIGQEIHLYGVFTFVGGVCYGGSLGCATTTSLVGSGVVDATVVLVNQFFFVRHVTYDFQTPEPATMILLGTGLLGVAGRIRSRRKSN